MSNRLELVEPDGRIIVLHFESWIARVLKPGSVNNCVTLSARHVFVARDYITANGLAHEVGHTLQAQRLGWRYLPAILWGYIRHGYSQSPLELEADLYMVAHANEYPAVTAP